MTTWTRYATLGGLAVVGLIGATDAARGADWDLFVLFAVVVVLVLPLSTSLDRRRRPVLLRTDLHDWVSRRSATTGESAEAIVDRCVARHKERLEPGGRAEDTATDDG